MPKKAALATAKPKKAAEEPVPPLRWASSLGQLEEVRKLLGEEGVDIECIGGIPATTSLQIAAFQGAIRASPARNLSLSHSPTLALTLSLSRALRTLCILQHRLSSEISRLPTSLPKGTRKS